MKCSQTKCALFNCPFHLWTCTLGWFFSLVKLDLQVFETGPKASKPQWLCQVRESGVLLCIDVISCFGDKQASTRTLHTSKIIITHAMYISILFWKELCGSSSRKVFAFYTWIIVSLSRQRVKLVGFSEHRHFLRAHKIRSFGLNKFKKWNDVPFHSQSIYHFNRCHGLFIDFVLYTTSMLFLGVKQRLRIPGFF